VAVSIAVRMPITHSVVWPVAYVWPRISSLLKKPARPGTPAIATVPIRKVQ
jgi:hypothetical protein